VLDDLAVLVESENIDARIVVIAGSVLKTMEHHEVAFSYRSLELDTLAGILPGHSLKVFDKRLLAVADMGIVLSI
jgi:hypothetical protein